MPHFMTLKWGIKHARGFQGGLYSLIWVRGRLVSGKCLVLYRPPLNGYITEVYGLSLLGSVCFVFSHKSCWKRGIYQFRCHSNGVVAEQRDLQLFALTAVCRLSVTGPNAPSICGSTAKINQRGIIQPSCCTTSLTVIVILQRGG